MRSPFLTAQSATNNSTIAFEELVAAHSSCEAAANQLLRKGDCQQELESIRKSLDATLIISRTECERPEVEMTSKKETTNPLLGAALSTTATGSKYIQPATLEVDDDPDDERSGIDWEAFRNEVLGKRNLLKS
jgi:hypothetical protein